MSDSFWTAIEAQCKEMAKAKSAGEVVAILNRYGSPSAGDAFFAGSGGYSMHECLSDAGWTTTWIAADYYWVMRAPDGSLLSYIEGDVQLGDTITKT
jgi:hypothetical protein